MLKVFIGWDQVEAVAYHTLCHSIIKYASVPVSITPLMLNQLPMTRPRDPKQSNEFSFSRFLVPWLCTYSGRALFMDCDMLLRTDIKELFDEFDYSKAVQVVKHDHKPKESIKYLGQLQTRYNKKNWSSVMLFNNERCTQLTPEYVNEASGLQLHQFNWLPEEKVGEISPEWNHLVGYDEYRRDAKNVHFTTGGPYFDEYRDCDYAEEWFAMQRDHDHCEQLKIKSVS